MESEKLIVKKNDLSAALDGERVPEIKTFTSTFTTVRVYDSDKMGIAFGIGGVDEGELKAKAEKNLSEGADYPCLLYPHVRKAYEVKNVLGGDTVKTAAEKLGALLASSLDGVKAIGNIVIEEERRRYTNSRESDLDYAGNNVSIHLNLVASGGEFCRYESTGDRFDEKAALYDCKRLASVLGAKPSVPQKPLPLAVRSGALLPLLAPDMSAELYEMRRLRGALGKRAFDSKLNLAVKRGLDARVSEAFFDAEGTLDTGFKIVENGSLAGLLSTKGSAAKRGLPLSASAFCPSFNSAPVCSHKGLVTLPTHKRVSDIVGDFIYIAEMPKVEEKPDGTVNMFVSLAYLVQGGVIAGRIPPMNVTSNVFMLYTSAYLGTASNTLFDGSCGYLDLFDAKKLGA